MSSKPRATRQSSTAPFETGQEAHSGLRVVGYLRVSSEAQVERGVSLDAQETRLRAYCAAHGLELVRIETDAGISAKKMANRPALQSALRSLRGGDVHGLVAVKLDRLSRSTRDVLELVERADRERWALHSIEERLDTGSPHGRFVLTVLAGLAQMEREQIGARTKAALEELRRQGRRVSGRPPFGYAFDGGSVVPAYGEQEILQRILELRAAGLGARRIARQLGEEGLDNPRTGRAWHASNVAHVLRTVERRGGGGPQRQYH